MSETPKEILRKCAFCGRNEKEVLLLIPSHDGKTYICENCTQIFSDFLDEHMYEDSSSEEIANELTLQTLPRPREIKEILDMHVIGQDNAKLALSVAVYNHYKSSSQTGVSRNF